MMSRRRARFKLALAAGLTIIGLHGASQAAPPPQAAERQSEGSLLHVEAQLYNPNRNHRGDRRILVEALDTQVFQFRVIRTPGDGTDILKRFENGVVVAACEASDWACIVLTGNLTVDVGYR